MNLVLPLLLMIVLCLVTVAGGKFRFVIPEHEHWMSRPPQSSAHELYIVIITRGTKGNAGLKLGLDFDIWPETGLESFLNKTVVMFRKAYKGRFMTLKLSINVNIKLTSTVMAS